jgi:uncharacterized phage-associated protein
MTAAAVAKYLTHLAAADPEGEPMTAMRLHKLLYYCQGWHLAWFGRPLFADRMEAWKYGPVVPSVDAEPWCNGRAPIPDMGEPADLTAEARESIEQVWSHYRKFSAYGLRDQTHDEAPWSAHYKPDAQARCSEEIPTADLAAFFGDEFRRKTGEEPGVMGAVSTAVATGHTKPLDQLRKELGC